MKRKEKKKERKKKKATGDDNSRITQGARRQWNKNNYCIENLVFRMTIW